MTGRRVAVATQEVHPWRAVTRTVLQALIALAAAAPLIVAAITGSSAEAAGGALALFITVSAAITRLMAVPVINGWLSNFGLGTEKQPKVPAQDPNLTDWHPAPDNRGKLGAFATLAILGLALTSLPTAPSINYPYTAHVQSVGWQGMTGDGAIAGTTGKALRLEALRFVFPGQQARAHVQDIGWQGWQANDATQIGTTGQGLRIEAVQVKSTIPGVHIECQAHVQGSGWLPRVGDGAVCGTTGKGLRLEAVRFWLVDNN